MPIFKLNPWMPIFEAEDSASHLEILLVLVGQRVVDLLDPPVGGDVVALRLRVEVHHDVLAARHRLHHPQQVQQRLVQIDLRRGWFCDLLFGLSIFEEQKQVIQRTH